MQLSDRRSFPDRRGSPVRTEQRPTTSTSLPEPAVTVEQDDGVSIDNSSGSPADSGNFKIWTPEMGPSPLDRRDRIPDEKTPGHEASPPSRTRTRKKGVEHPRTHCLMEYFHMDYSDSSHDTLTHPLT
ncbi:hypothetical protein EVAR_66755_1 [Eumeta japonica]|uniref:Uncharacterized protein n=1 Tax=Eumeta variegata TaxID=151549 RepID=A0A4C1Z7W9_EUMVA|nr:hypothetical protein EVAR_66755_1 [Eumeta japonica]